MIHGNPEDRWFDFTGFVSVPANQARVWRGVNGLGDFAYAKSHNTMGGFQRESRAYEALKMTRVTPTCIATDIPNRSLLLADAGHVLCGEPQTEDLGLEMWSVMSRMHRTQVHTDPVPMAMALERRWTRLQHRLGIRCSNELIAWMRARIDQLPQVPRVLVHRDLRPPHWYRHEHGLRLIDFGQARVDAVLFDAIPFYTSTYEPSVEAVVRGQFAATYGHIVMEQVDVFAVLYLCGTIERIIYREDVAEIDRAKRLCINLNAWSNAPLDFDELMTEGDVNVR